MEAEPEVKVNRHITLAESIAYLTEGWHVRPYTEPYKRGYALAWREADD